jgi:Na+/proline symporter
MVADISGISYFLPIITFLVVFVVIFALLAKTKILGESLFIQLFISFLLSTVFISASAPRDYVQAIIPWFAVILISLFVLMMIIGFASGKSDDGMNKTLGTISVVLLAIVLAVSAYFAFSGYISPYLPGGSASGANPQVLQFTNWIYSSRVAGAVLLVIAAAVVSWVLVKTAK